MAADNESCTLFHLKNNVAIFKVVEFASAYTITMAQELGLLLISTMCGDYVF